LICGFFAVEYKNIDELNKSLTILSYQPGYLANCPYEPGETMCSYNEKYQKMRNEKN
jgi:hypothetical protein